MNPVEKRLERLDREIAALTAERKAAETKWLSATDPQQERKLKEVYEAAKMEVKDRSHERRDLQLKLLPGAGAGFAAAAALPAEPGLQNFWYQLAAVEQLSKADLAPLLQLGNSACFPLEGNAVRGRLLVRQCYLDLAQQVHQHFSQSGRSFIITGNPGIGKSLFLYFLMWQLARSGRTVVWDRRDVMPVMFSSQGVVKGPLEAFESQLQDPETWYLVDGKPPANRRAKTVLVTSPDWDVWKEAKKRPDSVLRHMPVWSWEEIQAARQHIFSSQLKADVDSRYSRWGGIPRFVLELTDAADQALLTEALNSCSLSDLTSSMTNLSTASRVSHRLLHLTVKAGYLAGPVVFASDWVQGEVISRYLQVRQHEVHDFLAASGGEPSVAAFRGALWECHAHVALQRGGSFSCRDLQDPEAGPFEIELQPCSSSVGLWDVQDISTGLSSGVYGWGRSKNLPAVDAVVQPDKLFQITVSGDHRINARGLADAVRAMQADKLFFVVPPDVFSSYTKQTLKRIRGDLAAESVARAVKQFVLKVDI